MGRLSRRAAAQAATPPVNPLLLAASYAAHLIEPALDLTSLSMASRLPEALLEIGEQAMLETQLPWALSESRIEAHLARYGEEGGAGAMLRDITLALALTWQPLDATLCAEYLLALATHLRRCLGASQRATGDPPCNRDLIPAPPDLPAPWLSLLHVAGQLELLETLPAATLRHVDARPAVKLLWTRLAADAERTQLDPWRLLHWQRTAWRAQPADPAGAMRRNLAVVLRFREGERECYQAIDAHAELLILLEGYGIAPEKSSNGVVEVLAKPARFRRGRSP